jgi:beta-lactamase regulating signal transducer with metallopeptidase domain
MDAISRIFLTYLVNAAWQIPLIAVTFAFGVRLMRRLPAVYRHYVWVAALLASVLVPLVSLRTPDVPISIASTASSSPGFGRVHAPMIPSGSAVEGFSWSVLRRSRLLALTPLLRSLLLSLYVAFLLYRVARLAWAYYRTVRLRRSAFPLLLPDNLSDAVCACFRTFGIKPIPILCSPQAAGPFTVGIRAPVLVLPEAFIAKVPANDVRSAVGHELAHVRRYDFLLNLLYEIAYLPVSFHPVATWIKNRVDQSRELVCDEVAAATLTTRRGYASSLLNIAQTLSGGQQRISPSCALGLFDTNNMEERVMNLLGEAPIGKVWPRLSAIAASIILAASCLGISAYSLQVDHSPAQQFEGTWKAVHDGKTFILLQLHTENAHPTGTIQMAAFQLDLQGTGALVSVTDEKLGAPISLQNLKLDGKSLSFDFVDSDGDNDKWRMDLTGEDKVNFSWIGLPQELKALPIVLVKQASADSKAK